MDGYEALLASCRTAVERWVKAKISSLESLVNDLSVKIRRLEAAQADWSRVMQSSAYEMNHYRGYM